MGYSGSWAAGLAVLFLALVSVVGGVSLVAGVVALALGRLGRGSAGRRDGSS